MRAKASQTVHLTSIDDLQTSQNQAGTFRLTRSRRRIVTSPTVEMPELRRASICGNNLKAILPVRVSGSSCAVSNALSSSAWTLLAPSTSGRLGARSHGAIRMELTAHDIKNAGHSHTSTAPLAGHRLAMAKEPRLSDRTVWSGELGSAQPNMTGYSNVQTQDSRDRVMKNQLFPPILMSRACPTAWPI